MRNREVATEAEVESLVEDIRERLLSMSRPARGCGCCDRGGGDHGDDPRGKARTRGTIRSLRARLLADLHDATESAYRLSVHAREAGLDEAARARRGRLDDVDEGAGAGPGQAGAGRPDRDGLPPRGGEAGRLHAAEPADPAPAHGGTRPLRRSRSAVPVVTGGWESRGYQNFRQLAPGIVRGDETEGYAFLLRLVFEDLATELPGLYGPAGSRTLSRSPRRRSGTSSTPSTPPALESCWTDDMTLGWVYQYWNDPEREALDAKLNARRQARAARDRQQDADVHRALHGRLAAPEQPRPDVAGHVQEARLDARGRADGTLDRLEERRADWRAKRAAGEVALTELMPLHTDAERRWAYYLPQPIPADAVAQRPRASAT